MSTSVPMQCAKAVVIALVFGCAAVASAAEQNPKNESVAPAPAPAPAVVAAPKTAAAEAPAAQQESVVARVNGVDIKSIDLRRARKVILSNPRNAVQRPEQLKDLDRQAINQLISAELLYQAGSKLEIKDIDKQVEAKMAQGRQRFPKAEDFEKAIKELEMDQKDLLAYTRRDLIISNFIENTIASKVVVSEEDARKFYDQNPDKFSRGESVRASHILIGADAKSSEEDRKKAREKAEKLRKELATGADFAALAKANSTCPSSQQGGDLGFFGKGQMVAPFEKSAFGLKPGEVSDVVETTFGYHIIKLTEKKGAETVAFKDVRPRIEEFLKGQKVNAAIGEYLGEARKTAKIDILLK